MQLAWIRDLLPARGMRRGAPRSAARVHSGDMGRKLDDADRLAVRMEVSITAGTRAAIQEVVDRLSAEMGRRVSEGDVVRMLLTRGLKAMAVSIKRLPGPPARPPRGAQRKPAKAKR